MQPDRLRAICFYLPQYHPIPENDERWGAGFTDWLKVVQGRPFFKDHYQPRLPADTGFYDLRVQETQELQAKLASEYGVAGFCYYYYWFSGRKVLERPLEKVISSGAPDFPFCVCWANHDWINTWTATPRLTEGSNDQELLIKQTYSDEATRALIKDLLPAFEDHRYIRIQNKPVFIVYDSAKLPDATRFAEICREEAKSAGLEDLYLCRIESFGTMLDPGTQGFDACIEFPPHGYQSISMAVESLPGQEPYAGTVYEYANTAFQAVNRPTRSYKVFRGVMPGWDNTVRRPPHIARIWQGATPGKYYSWLKEAALWTRENHEPDEQLLFINAWNEWAECAYLEPDLKYGHAYLEATRDALSEGMRNNDPDDSNIRRVKVDKSTGIFTSGGRSLSEGRDVVGVVDKVWEQSGNICLAGWACDKKNPESPVIIALSCDNQLIAVERTMHPRPDVAKAISKEATRTGFHMEFDAGRLAATGGKSPRLTLISTGDRTSTLDVKLPINKSLTGIRR